ncbi:hypothetical protein CPB83DRAFT_272894 [Crepidotus variabilis]|uniref:VanZ-like domain-containing protein n=1 Tax=Crepidotus variabilis TaxID=179855 RepID=A0A9P6EHK5_9AGAR|nr:hypothetical protein CPB83DRAFT_272894 [Crepidotus variabilis]
MASKTLRRWSSKISKKLMKSYKVKIPKYNLPVRVRPWFVLLTSINITVLAILGFTNIHPKLPLPDKVSHSIAFFVATSVFYFIIDVDESARRIWFWRYFSTMLTVFTCHFLGGVLIEIVQAVLPFKQLELGDILANLLGASLGLWVAFNLERYYRHRKEISRLYRPLSATVSEFEEDEEEDEDDERGVQLLPTHANHKGKGASRLTDVWDEREELFGIGEESDDDDEDEASSSQAKPQTPKIVISHP